MLRTLNNVGSTTLFKAEVRALRARNLFTRVFSCFQTAKSLEKTFKTALKQNNTKIWAAMINPEQVVRFYACVPGNVPATDDTSCKRPSRWLIASNLASSTLSNCSSYQFNTSSCWFSYTTVRSSLLGVSAAFKYSDL